MDALGTNAEAKLGTDNIVRSVMENFIFSITKLKEWLRLEKKVYCENVVVCQIRCPNVPYVCHICVARQHVPKNSRQP